MTDRVFPKIPVHTQDFNEKEIKSFTTSHDFGVETTMRYAEKDGILFVISIDIFKDKKS